MTNKFTTPCFVCVEDVEKRKELTEWLKGIGYYVCTCCLFDGWNTLHCGPISEVHGIPDYDAESKYGIGQFKAEEAAKEHPAIDCGTDIELFKALAAMNDQNDHMQWFIAECDINDQGIILWHEEEFGLYDEIVASLRDLFRKATTEEIVNHFKSK